jgi:hypothetical protein
LYSLNLSDISSKFDAFVTVNLKQQYIITVCITLNKPAFNEPFLNNPLPPKKKKKATPNENFGKAVMLKIYILLRK